MLQTPFAAGSITGFELYGFDIEAPLGQTDLSFTGTFGEGTFVVPIGFGSQNFETTQWTNVGVFVDAQAAVPEPRTWVMMLAGFGLLGFAAMRKGNREPRLAI